MNLWSLTVDEIKNCIRAHYRIQLGQFYSETKEITGGVVAYSNRISSFVWNHAALESLEDDRANQFIADATSILTAHNKSSAIYFSPASGAGSKVLSLIEETGYKQMDEEAWMFYLDNRPPKYELPQGMSIGLVRTQKQMDDFMRLFNASYEGIAPTYGEALSEQFADPIKSEGVHHFIAYLLEEPVSILTLNVRDGYAGIYSVGTPPSHRQKGYGSIISMYASEQALRMNCKGLFLQCERDAEGPEHIYRRIGFATVFVRLGYVLKQ